MALFWTILTIVLAVLEASTAQLICIWFAGGSFIALISALCSVGVFAQWVIFIISSAIILSLTRPIVNKLKKNGKEKTNIDALIGKTCVVKEEIDNLKECGRVSINGIEWSARNVQDGTIEEGATVKVLKIEGVKLIVERM